MHTKRAAAYCRVSTEKASQLDSYAAQRDFFVLYCQRAGYELVHIYGDEGKSGTRLKGRPQLAQLLRDAESGSFELVLVKDVSRLARNVLDFLSAVRTLRELGVEVLFVNADLSSSTGSEFILTVLSAIAGKIGILVASLSNGRCAEGAQKGIKPAFLIGFRGGAVMGLLVVGCSLFGVAAVLMFVGDASILLGFSFGASSLALFAKAGGGVW